jgi:ABC-type Zn uptake system ZnuABC Zn-binding protein ZnuA
MQSIGMDLNTKVPFSENVLHDTSAAHLAELVEEIELHGIRHAFTEPQFEAGNLQKLANDYNLTVGTLDPHGTNPGANGYLENLKSNLENLANVYE